MLFSSFKYSIDTSSLLVLLRAYPEDLFPAVWLKLDDMISKGIVCSTEEVYYEILVQEDRLAGWAKDRRQIFLPHDAEVQQNVRKILSTHSNLIDIKKNKSGADPFLIAVAIANNCVVVTEEKISGGPQRSKIPDVCMVYNIECITILEMLRREGLGY